jgi:regulator of sirC expression with transglutaminase-like and TPR domain
LLPIIDSCAASLRSAIRDPSGTAVVSSLRKLMYSDWGVRFNPKDISLRAFLPQAVYSDRQGTCLGMALLMLLIAEKNKYPLYGVVLPGHFFLRFDNGTQRVNIEPNAKGIERTDEYYRDRYAVAPGSWYYPLRNLSKKETAALFFYMLGNLYREKAELSRSQWCYMTCLNLFPDYPDALGNLALVYAAHNKSDSAMALLDRAGRINPDDQKVWLNKGALFMRQGNYQAALAMYKTRLAQAPENSALLYGCAMAYIGLQQYDSARTLHETIRRRGDTLRLPELERHPAKHH